MLQVALHDLVQTGSDVADIRSSIPRSVGVRLVGILNLAHGRTATADTTAQVGAAAASVHNVDSKGGDECGPSEPEESGSRLGLTTVLLGVCGAVEDLIGAGVSLNDIRQHDQSKGSGKLTAFEQLCAPMYAGSATAAQKPKRTLNPSIAMSTMGILNFSMKDVGRKYSNVNNHHTPTKSE